MGKTIEQFRAELDALNRRNIVVPGRDGSQTAESTIPPLGDSDGGPATEAELAWFRMKHPGEPDGQADGPIRCRRQWLAFLGLDDAAKRGWL